MKFVHQTIMHDPANGQYGDCHRAAIATVLGLEIEDVPHFLHDNCGGEEFTRREKVFLALHNLCPVSIPYQAGDLGDILRTVEALNGSDLVYLLAGRSRTGCNHSVVCRGGDIVHDPNPQKPGIIGPCDDGWYWLQFFCDLRVSKQPNQLDHVRLVSA